MATVPLQFLPCAVDLPSSSAAIIGAIQGTNFPIAYVSFAAGVDRYCYLVFRATGYGSGNVTVDIDWYADTAASGDVIFGAALSVITPNTDTQDVETDAFDTAGTVTDSHLGTTNQRQHRATITISNLDSLAADDLVVCRIYRNGASGSDTMSGAALVRLVQLSYSDT